MLEDGCSTDQCSFSTLHWLCSAVNAMHTIWDFYVLLREKISLASSVSSYWKMNTLDASRPWWCNWFLYGQGGNPSKHLKNCDCSEATMYRRIVTSNITRLASNLYFMSFFSLLFYPISNLPKQNFGFMQIALLKSIIFILLLFSFL